MRSTLSDPRSASADDSERDPRAQWRFLLKHMLATCALLWAAALLLPVRLELPAGVPELPAGCRVRLPQLAALSRIHGLMRGRSAEPLGLVKGAFAGASVACGPQRAVAVASRTALAVLRAAAARFEHPSHAGAAGVARTLGLLLAWLRDDGLWAVWASLALAAVCALRAAQSRAVRRAGGPCKAWFALAQAAVVCGMRADGPRGFAMALAGLALWYWTYLEVHPLVSAHYECEGSGRPQTLAELARTLRSREYLEALGDHLLVLGVVAPVALFFRSAALALASMLLSAGLDPLSLALCLALRLRAPAERLVAESLAVVACYVAARAADWRVLAGPYTLPFELYGVAYLCCAAVVTSSAWSYAHYHSQGKMPFWAVKVRAVLVLAGAWACGRWAGVGTLAWGSGLALGTVVLSLPFEWGAVIDE
eukprot:m51a1_g8393 hypothetical protein (424) ;mRNA; r:215492-216763